MAAAVSVDVSWSSARLTATGPLSADEAADMVATLCEAAVEAGQSEHLLSVSFETDRNSPGRGIDYEGVVLNGAQCEALRKIASLMGLDDGVDGAGRLDHDSQELAFEMEVVTSATLTAARLETRIERLAKLERLTGYAP